MTSFSTPRFDPSALSVYLVTSGDDAHTVDTAAACARGGAGMIQVRLKNCDARAYTDLVVRVADAVHEANPSARVLVDDRVDVAYAARFRGAEVHGVHIGQSDIDPLAARALLGPDAIIGLTTGTLELVQQAQAFHSQHPGVLDYVGAGPFRPTPTKDSGRSPLGLEGYGPLVAATDLPIVAIGDVTPNDVEALAGMGVAGCAMVRSLMQAEDPEAITRQAVHDFRVGHLRHQLAAIKKKINDAAGPRASQVRVLPVSKTYPSDVLVAAMDAGMECFGENRPQELRDKAQDCAEQDRHPHWVAIGQLQRNKAKYVAQWADEFQALDSLELAAELNKQLERFGRTLKVMIQVNSSGETQKSGLFPADVAPLLDALREFDRLKVIGMMTVAANRALAGDAATAACFQRMQSLQQSLLDQGYSEVQELSMGMSDDFDLALAHGATCVRIGSAIFGSRPTPRPS